MRKMVILAALASTALATTAYAGEPGPYIEVEGGATISENQHVSSPGGLIVPAGQVATIHNKLGYDVGGSIGYDFGHFRLEGEASYHRLNPKRVYTAAGTITQGNGLYGHVATFAAMGNALFEFGMPHGAEFYAGGGVGYAKTHELVQVAPFGGLAGQKDKFAWQLIAGVSVPVSEHFDIGLKYRYFHPEADRFHFSDGTPLYVKLRTHSVLATLTYRFGTPTPPPA
jgi:OOP family OmpA-OmpF porin